MNQDPHSTSSAPPAPSPAGSAETQASASSSDSPAGPPSHASASARSGRKTERRPLRALVVEDRPSDAELLLTELDIGGFEVTYERVETAEAMRRALATKKWDIVLSDYSLPTFDALRAIAVLKETKLDLPFIVVTGTLGEETAVEVLRAGARDFIVKGRLTRLLPAIDRELREAASRAVLRRTEEQLRHAQKMEAVGRLAGGVAHDFNNVLTVILLNAELLTERVESGAATTADVAEITTAAERASELTKQLLAFSRQQVMELRIVDISQIVWGLEKMLRRLIGEDVELVTDLCGGIGKVEADPGQIEQVVMNLAVNARDAMTKRGKVVIKTSNVAPSEVPGEFEPGSWVLLSVSDNGEGIDEATRARIFEPFFTTKEVGHGTGLGLSTVFGIVQQSRGHIRVQSEPGVGTTFDVYLPRTDRARVQASTRPASVSTLQGNETIVLVEDDAAVRNVVSIILRRQGYRLIEAQNGLEALALCEMEKTIDLLLTDVVMPRMSGRELSERLREQCPRLKVLFMSGYTNAAIAQHGIDNSHVAFLQKPITPEPLLRRVREVLDTSNAAHAST